MERNRSLQCPRSEAYAEGSLVLDHAGNLYGTSNYGGTYNYGTVFELAHSGKVWTKRVIYNFTGGRKETTLFSFNANENEINPTISLVVDPNGLHRQSAQRRR